MATLIDRATSTYKFAQKSEAPCRSCGGRLEEILDLGMSPLCESFVSQEQLDHMEPFYPLQLLVCTRCLLVQLKEYVTPEAIFSDYAYFSSFSPAWLEHARRYTETVVDRFGLGRDSMVVEVASNDGYLLRNFVERGIPVLGVEPAANVAAAATAIGVPTRVAFFGADTASEIVRETGGADLIAANNVLAHVPDLHSFVEGISALLRPGGVFTAEFPHVLRLIEGNQFDTIYHEHFCYFSLHALEPVLAAHGLRLFDVEELWTHGGSLRLYVCPAGSGRPEEPRVQRIRGDERAAGLDRIEAYRGFARNVERTKRRLLELLIRVKEAGHSIAGYGAPGKGNTLLNYCGIRTDFLDYTVDRNPHKHGKFLPGTRIPIRPVEAIARTKPDYVLILPWNLRQEIMEQMSGIRAWGGRFIVPIPEAAVFD